MRFEAVAGLPRFHAAASERLGAVGEGEVVVDADDAAKTFAGRARADGVVVAEERGGRLAVVEIAGGAVEARRKEMRSAKCEVRNRGDAGTVDGEFALAVVVGLFAGFDETGAGGGGGLEAVLNDGECGVRARNAE